MGVGAANSRGGGRAQRLVWGEGGGGRWARLPGCVSGCRRLSSSSDACGSVVVQVVTEGCALLDKFCAGEDDSGRVVGDGVVGSSVVMR